MSISGIEQKIGCGQVEELIEQVLSPSLERLPERLCFYFPTG